MVQKVKAIIGVLLLLLMGWVMRVVSLLWWDVGCGLFVVRPGDYVVAMEPPGITVSPYSVDWAAFVR